MTDGTRQVSPNTLFGGIDALVESQDWWLRDQASLAIGFENWMSAGNGDASMTNSVNGVRSETNAGLENVDPLTGAGTAFYVRQNGTRMHDQFTDDDWNYS